MNDVTRDMPYTDIHIEENNLVKTFVLFLQASREVIKYIDLCLRRGADLSMVQFITLMVLVNRSGPVRPSEIAQWTQTERHNVTTLLQRMERDKLIKVARDSYDKRYVNVKITEKGQETFAKGVSASKKFVDQIIHSFNEDDLNIFSKLLHLTLVNAHSGLESVEENKRRIVKKYR